MPIRPLKTLIEVYHQTGNVVLLSLASEEKPGIEV